MATRSYLPYNRIGTDYGNDDNDIINTRSQKTMESPKIKVHTNECKINFNSEFIVSNFLKNQIPFYIRKECFFCGEIAEDKVSIQPLSFFKELDFNEIDDILNKLKQKKLFCSKCIENMTKTKESGINTIPFTFIDKKSTSRESLNNSNVNRNEFDLFKESIKSEIKNFETNLLAKKEKDCVVCMEKPATHSFIPCGHKCLCKDCGEVKEANENEPQIKFKSCVMCRKECILIIPIFD
jgi:hypothetical protein